MSSGRRRMLLWSLPVTLMLLSGLLFAGLVFASETLNGFGIDSDDPVPQNALYSGFALDGEPSNDWAAGPVTGSGVFQLSAAVPHTATGAEPCYGSNVDFGDVNGVAAFICDGHSNSTFSQEDRNIVSGGKQLDDIWTIKNPSGGTGVGTGKSDFTHAYAYLSFGDSCADEDTNTNSG